MDNPHESKIFFQEEACITMSVAVLLNQQPRQYLTEKINYKFLFSTTSVIITCYPPSHCASLLSVSLGRYKHLRH